MLRRGCLGLFADPEDIGAADGKSRISSEYSCCSFYLFSGSAIEIVPVSRRSGQADQHPLHTPAIYDGYFPGEFTHRPAGTGGIA